MQISKSEVAWIARVSSNLSASEYLSTKWNKAFSIFGNFVCSKGYPKKGWFDRSRTKLWILKVLLVNSVPGGATFSRLSSSCLSSEPHVPDALKSHVVMPAKLVDPVLSLLSVGSICQFHCPLLERRKVWKTGSLAEAPLNTFCHKQKSSNGFVVLGQAPWEHRTTTCHSTFSRDYASVALSLRFSPTFCWHMTWRAPLLPIYREVQLDLTPEA